MSAPVPRASDNRFWTLYFNAFRLRCPICKEGKIFVGWFGVETHCPVCHTEIEREDGYLIGSIYFNYGSTGVLMTLGYLIGRFYFHLPDRLVLPVLTAFAALYPLFFLRYARSSFMAFDQYFNPRAPGEESTRRRRADHE